MFFPFYFCAITLVLANAASRGNQIDVKNMQTIEDGGLKMKFRQLIRSFEVQTLKHDKLLKTLQKEVADLKKENRIKEQLMMDQQNEIRKLMKLFHLIRNRTCTPANRQEKQWRVKRSHIEDQHLRNISSNFGFKQYTEDTTELSRVIAFSAFVNSDITVTGKQIVVFGHILTNRGTAYNGATGMFTCKTAGTYVFLWTIARQVGSVIETDLVLNGNHVGFGASTSDSRYEISGSNTAILDLNEGDNVWIVVRYIARDRSSVSTLWGQWSTFSGFLLR